MTAPRREWLATFADPAVLSDLRSAITSMMHELDDCDPEECLHAEQRVIPIEVLHWIEREVHVASQRPSRFEPGHRPRRMKNEPPLNLAIAG